MVTEYIRRHFSATWHWQRDYNLWPRFVRISKYAVLLFLLACSLQTQDEPSEATGVKVETNLDNVVVAKGEVLSQAPSAIYALTGVVVNAGLDDLVTRESPMPWIKVQWDEPASFAPDGVDEQVIPTPSAGYPAVRTVGVAIMDESRESIMREPWDWTEDDSLWAYLLIGPPEMNILILDAGCSVSASHVIVTADCVDRKRHLEILGFQRFRANALQAGATYYVMVMFVVETSPWDDWQGHYSDVYRVTIPDATR